MKMSEIDKKIEIQYSTLAVIILIAIALGGYGAGEKIVYPKFMETINHTANNEHILKDGKNAYTIYPYTQADDFNFTMIKYNITVPCSTK